MRRPVIAAVHQPNYLPWLGYFYKISKSDWFIFLDSVPFSSSGSFTNRNAIKSPAGSTWLTIPVLHSGRTGQPIAYVEAKDLQSWRHKHLASLRSNYGRAPFFAEVFALLEPHYSVPSNGKTLVANFNIPLICTICEYLGIWPRYIRSSEINAEGRRTDLLINLCKTIGADTYLAGAGGKAYQDDEAFIHASITPLHSEFAVSPYPQLFGPFVPNLSIVDVLMNCGREGTRRLLGIAS